MRIKNIVQLNDFIAAVNKCTGQVWLETNEGDKFNLKSTFSQYIAYSALLTERTDSLELFCSKKEDEALFFQYLQKHPEVNAG